MDMLMICARNGLRDERVYRDNSDPLHFSDIKLIQKYRLPRFLLLEIIQECSPSLERPTDRSHALSVSLQVLICLRYFASGGFYQLVGDSLSISKASVCRIVHTTAECISNVYRNNIQFPSTRTQLMDTCDSFANFAGMPRTIGAIDCTHVALSRPTQNEYLYINRKYFHSINVQAVCNADRIFTNVVIKYPGSTHDSFIWKNCGLKNNFLRGDYGDYFLIGDSGYPQRIFLMVPLLNPLSDQQKRYNKCLKKSRVVIECSFGLLKARWQCLDKSAGPINMSPQRAVPIIMACFALHNLATSYNVPAPIAEQQAIELEMLQNVLPINPNDNSESGKLARQQLINQFF
jgi:hypothetical protein